MRFMIKVLRKGPADAEGHFQTVRYENDDAKATVATFLTDINNWDDAVDVDGNEIGSIRWECSCLQKKCGACAMVINGLPRLACDSFLMELGPDIIVEPLRKFPVVADLIVDRNILREHLLDMEMWNDHDSELADRDLDMAYDASRCLQCGCCIEVCPNCSIDSEFYGAAAFVPNARVTLESGGSRDRDERKHRKKIYNEHVFNGCGKSLACRDICPAGIDIDHLLSKQNRRIVWKI